jgi:predicted chitinase
MKKFVITEQDKQYIRNLYKLSESESSLGKLLNFLSPSDTKDEDEIEDLDSETTSDTENDTINDITSLNDNENIVLKQLKKDGFTDEATAAVMGVVGGESGFKTFKEASYKTTANSRIRAIFGSKLGNMSDSELDKLKQSDEAFFNKVYGGMYGNAPNEGYKYVGRGFNGITFQGNYKAAQECTGIGFLDNPELMEKPENAAKALSCYFKKVKDINDFEKAFQETYRQNAGPGNTWEFYANNSNPVNVVGIPLKKGKAKEYYKKIKSIV